jgi:purine-nucleoside phosphorylase
VFLKSATWVPARSRQEQPLVSLQSPHPGLPQAAIAAAETIRRQWNRQPAAGLVLGTGLGDLSATVTAEASIPYGDIPGFPRCTALGHAGRLVCGRINGKDVILMDGRCHGYEGYTLDQLQLPVLTMRALGARLLVLSNASGGLNPNFASGDIVVIDDHIDLMFWRRRAHCGRIPEDCVVADPAPDVGQRPPRWPLAEPGHPIGNIYDSGLSARAMAVSRKCDFVAHRGVYVGVTGPNYETRAEYRFLREAGGDVVGMSTIPEAIAAWTCGMRTLALSTVTNVACPDRTHIVFAEDVVGAAQRAQPHVGEIVLDVISNPSDS